MAKVQAAKSKSSFGDFLKKLGGNEPKAKPAARAPASPQAGSRPPAAKVAAAERPQSSGWSMENFRVPVIGRRPVLVQLQILGTLALLLIAVVAGLVFLDVNSRSINATYITIASQMQYHTQRLAKAAGIAARGQPTAFPQVQDSRDEFANFLGILGSGGFAFGQTVPSAGTTDELKSRIDELNQRWPESSAAASAILAAQRDLVALAQNIAQIRVGSEEMATLSQELTGLMSQSGSPPGQVLRANRMTFLAERLGRGSAEILGADVIDPEVPFLIGKDTNDLRALIAALEVGSESLGIVPVRDSEARAKLAELKKQFAIFEQNVGPILRELQKLVTARQAGAKLVAASEQLQSAVGRLQEAIQAEKSDATLYAIAIVSIVLFVVLVLMALVFLADTRRSAAVAESENK